MIDIFDVSESVKRLSSEEIQKQQWMAETMGGFHQFLPFLFQNISGIVFFYDSLHIFGLKIIENKALIYTLFTLNVKHQKYLENLKSNYSKFIVGTQ